jgi:hypothetical protein
MTIRSNFIKALAGPALLGLVALSTGCTHSQPLAQTVASPGYCGGKLSSGELSQYLAKLDQAVTQGHVPQDLGPSLRGDSPTIADWKVISAAVASGKLESVGYRGCILSNGKASFQSDGAGNFVLDTFDASRAWEL